MRVKDKVVIVTGSGGGIGEGIAHRMATEGAKVVVNDIHAAAGEKVAAAIRAQGGTASFVVAAITLSKSLAAELGPDNIRVNCIIPVFNPDTGLSVEFAGGLLDDARRAKFLSTIPLGRFSTALDAANAALYLASDEAAFISGVCIEVDGARCV